ncbi:hypothetical protein D4764_01G0014450 [Takifugu flavidus]|uniref:Uncharacterized protein n=1 Tax=Takifugu flavidus TaxID=433684 RepID=A0A5C6PTD1_9TELE|nr:hypothetical protein D4764_01G0014450 [Takifugu flavidus]
MTLDCGRKPEYLERTHASTGRTCKLHTESPQPQSQLGIESRAFLRAEEQRLYSKLLPDGRASHPIPKGEPSHPTEEAHFGHLYP